MRQTDIYCYIIKLILPKITQNLHNLIINILLRNIFSLYQIDMIDLFYSVNSSEFTSSLSFNLINNDYLFLGVFFIIRKSVCNYFVWYPAKMLSRTILLIMNPKLGCLGSF